MDGKGARSKGANGENEFLKLLSAELAALGVDIPDGGFKRNLDQTREGGFDNCASDELSHFAIEIRRRENLSVESWWKKVSEMALEEDRLPVLAYRQNRKPWSIRLPFFTHITQLSQPQKLDTEKTITIDLKTFAFIAENVIGMTFTTTNTREK